MTKGGIEMDRVEFTKEMKQDYTILIPDMLTVHWMLLIPVLESYGYKMEVLRNQSRAVIDEGLKYVHNDMCYPALLVIGQFLDALKSGKYDVNKTALMITQTGGGCRASNYLHLLRKALQKAGYGHIPVISLNFSGLEKNSGFRFTLPMIRRALAALAYGDLLMLLKNQTKPYELQKGDSDALLEHWTARLLRDFAQGKNLDGKQRTRVFGEIAASFAAIPRDKKERIRVGVVGEIYVKYAPLGNNNLEEFLYRQGCETMVPGVLDFAFYCIQNSIEDHRLYGGKTLKTWAFQIAKAYISSVKDQMNEAVATYGFIAPSPYNHLTQLAEGVIDRGCKMGEGWLLTAEMMELVELGYKNIVCVQPFGCLPNHIIGKGMIRTVKAHCPTANIVPVDYDPGATRVNQENRIKLMLAVAKENMTK